MVAVVAIVLLVMLFTIIAEGGVVNHTCPVSRCNDEGPTIHYPFWLKQSATDQQPSDDCAFPPGFQLYCERGRSNRIHNEPKNNTIVKFQHLVNSSVEGLQLTFHYEAIVNRISYAQKYMVLRDTPYLTRIVPNFVQANTSSKLNQNHDDSDIYTRYDHYGYGPYGYSSVCYHSARNFRTGTFFHCEENIYPCYKQTRNYTFFNCSSILTKVMDMSVDRHVSSLSTNDFQVYAYPSRRNTIQMLRDISSCTKMYNISSKVPYFLPTCESEEELFRLLSWSTPIGIQKCDAVRNNCKFDDENDSTTTYIPPNREGSGFTKTKRRLVAVIVPCVFLVVLGLVFLYYFTRLDKQRKVDELKIKMFMEDYKALKPTRYSYSDIKKMTNTFKHKLGQGGFGSVFKGQISTDILVAVKVLHSDPKADGDDFINEVGTIGKIHHVNVVRLLGYCADGCNRALVYEFQPNHSLEKFVYRREKQQSFIGWKKMQKIALGVAKGIDYLHQGCAQQILHFDIKPNNILLDKNFNPKISDFGLAKLCNKGQSIVSMTMARGTIGYIAPEVFSRNFGNVSSKSDVYSFGMLLLEMVGGKNNTDAQEVNTTSEVYFPEWIFHRLEKGGEVAIQVENEDDPMISRKLTIVGLWCIGWHPIDRPSMKLVIQMLKGDACPAMPPNPFSSATNSGNTARAKSFFSDKLDVISETE